VDGTGAGSCPMAGFGISGAEPSGSATIELLSYLSNKLSNYGRVSYTNIN